MLIAIFGDFWTSYTKTNHTMGILKQKWASHVFLIQNFEHKMTVLYIGCSETPVICIWLCMQLAEKTFIHWFMITFASLNLKCHINSRLKEAQKQSVLPTCSLYVDDGRQWTLYVVPIWTKIIYTNRTGIWLYLPYESKEWIYGYCSSITAKPSPGRLEHSVHLKNERQYIYSLRPVTEQKKRTSNYLWCLILLPGTHLCPFS